MLVLTRRVNEVIRIGDDIQIKILARAGQQIRIGIEAPSHIPVHRQEVYEKISKEKHGEEFPHD